MVFDKWQRCTAATGDNILSNLFKCATSHRLPAACYGRRVCELATWGYTNLYRSTRRWGASSDKQDWPTNADDGGSEGSRHRWTVFNCFIYCQLSSIVLFTAELFWSHLSVSSKWGSVPYNGKVVPFFYHFVKSTHWHYIVTYCTFYPLAGT